MRKHILRRITSCKLKISAITTRQQFCDDVSTQSFCQNYIISYLQLAMRDVRAIIIIIYFNSGIISEVSVQIISIYFLIAGSKFA